MTRMMKRPCSARWPVTAIITAVSHATARPRQSPGHRGAGTPRREHSRHGPATALLDPHPCRRDRGSTADGARRLARRRAPPYDSLVSAAEPDLAEILKIAGAAWPGVAVSPERYQDYLAERADPGCSRTVECAVDLYLACACTDGDQAAIAAFIGAHQRHIESVVRALGGRDQDIEEVREQVLHFLFVADGGRPPGIATYSGRGRLRSWVRAIAARTGARYLGDEYQHPLRARGGAEEILRALPTPGDDPELQHLRARFGEAFRAAFARALQELSSRERNLLRQHYIDRLTIDKLGALYHVHRATAARWVAAARENVFEETRAYMMESEGIQTTDLDSILRLLHSQLDVSIQRFLAGGEER